MSGRTVSAAKKEDRLRRATHFPMFTAEESPPSPKSDSNTGTNERAEAADQCAMSSTMTSSVSSGSCGASVFPPSPQSASLTTLQASAPGCGGSIGSRMLNPRSEEHTSELQSRSDLVCRLLLEKKKKK